MGVWFVGGELGPFICCFIALNSLVARAPADLDLDVRFLGSEGGDVSPGFEGVLLPWSRFVGGHPRDGRGDGDCPDWVVPGGCRLEGPGKSSALGVVGFLAPAHVGLEAFPVVFFLPDRRVPCCTVL